MNWLIWFFVVLVTGCHLNPELNPLREYARPATLSSYKIIKPKFFFRLENICMKLRTRAPSKQVTPRLRRKIKVQVGSTKQANIRRFINVTAAEEMNPANDHERTVSPVNNHTMQATSHNTIPTPTVHTSTVTTFAAAAAHSSMTDPRTLPNPESLFQDIPRLNHRANLESTPAPSVSSYSRINQQDSHPRDRLTPSPRPSNHAGSSVITRNNVQIEDLGAAGGEHPQHAVTTHDVNKQQMMARHSQERAQLCAMISQPSFNSPQEMYEEIRARSEAHNTNNANLPFDAPAVEQEKRLGSFFCEMFHLKEVDFKEKMSTLAGSTHDIAHRAEINTFDTKQQVKSFGSQLHDVKRTTEALKSSCEEKSKTQEELHRQLELDMRALSLDVTGLKIGLVTTETNVADLYTEVVTSQRQSAVMYNALKDLIRDNIVNELAQEAKTVVIAGIDTLANRDVTRGDWQSVYRCIITKIPALKPYMDKHLRCHTETNTPDEGQPNSNQVSLYITYLDWQGPAQLTKAFAANYGRQMGLRCWISKPKRVRLEIKKFLEQLNSRQTPATFYKVEIGKVFSNERGYLLASYASSTPNRDTGRYQWKDLLDSNRCRVRIDLTETDSYKIFSRFSPDREHFNDIEPLLTTQNYRLHSNTAVNNEFQVTSRNPQEGQQSYEDWLTTTTNILSSQFEEYARQRELLSPPADSPDHPRNRSFSTESEHYMDLPNSIIAPTGPPPPPPSVQIPRIPRFGVAETINNSSLFNITNDNRFLQIGQQQTPFSNSVPLYRTNMANFPRMMPLMENHNQQLSSSLNLRSNNNLQGQAAPAKRYINNEIFRPAFRK